MYKAYTNFSGGGPPGYDPPPKESEGLNSPLTVINFIYGLDLNIIFRNIR